MKVLIITTAFPRWYGDGRGAFIYEAAQAIKRQGCEVRVIAMHVPGAKTREWMDGIEVIRPRYLPERWEILAKDSAGIPQAWRTTPWAKLALIPFVIVHALTVMRYAREADILHANWTLSGMVAWLTQWYHRKPYVVTVQGSDIFQGLKIPVVRQLSFWTLRQADLVLALSRALAREVQSLGVEETKIKIVPNGVHLEPIQKIRQKILNREPVILFVGSLFWRKGVTHLLEAFIEVSCEIPEYRVVFVGEGDQKQILEKRAHDAGLEKRVIFTGNLPHNDVLHWMCRSKVLVLPSVEEGQGVVLLEAMACGTPCIGSNVGGIPDIITADCGYLFDPGNVEELANNIKNLVQNDREWEEKSHNSQNRAKNIYDWDKIASCIVEYYRNTKRD
ncbi:MAG: glycosyltransferase [Candidatus Jordarchaeaceae archaeon]